MVTTALSLIAGLAPAGAVAAKADDVTIDLAIGDRFDAGMVDRKIQEIEGRGQRSVTRCAKSSSLTRPGCPVRASARG